MKVNDIISYRQMCDEENIQTLQRGMNYGIGDSYSVVLMSTRANAPYDDAVHADGKLLEYEGHDAPQTSDVLYPKLVDQPIASKSGKLTQNGLFVKAVDEFKEGIRSPELVRVYEKVFSGVWTYRGMFRLIDYNIVVSNRRKVFRFMLSLSERELTSNYRSELATGRAIPSSVKKEVWKRDGGKCRECGASDNLHFDHIIPFSRGGSSVTVENVQILCARHNLKKGDKIE